MALILSQYAYSNEISEVTSLTEYERFISYPYIEKAYRLQRQGNYQDALTEALYAIERAPRYRPFKQLAIELALSLKDLDEILSLIATEKSNAFMLEMWLELVLQSKNPELIYSYIEKLNQQVTLNTQDTASIMSRVIIRLIGLNAYDSAISIFKTHSQQVNFERQIIEMIMFAHLEKGNVQGALLHIASYGNIDSDIIENTYIDLLLQSENNSQDVFNEFIKLSDKQLSLRGIRAWTQQQIAQFNYSLAKLGFSWLTENVDLSQTEKLQYLTLLTESKDPLALQLIRLPNFSCNQKIDTYLEFDQTQDAKEILLSCLQNVDEIYSWEAYATALLSAKEILELNLDDKDVLERLNKIAIERYIAQNKTTELINNLAGKQDAWSLGILLEVYQSTLNWSKGAQTAHQLFLLTSNSRYLDIATFLYTQSENTNKTKQLLISNLPFEGSFKRILHERLLSLLKPSDLIINDNLFNYLIEYDDPSFVSADLIRASLQCKKAITAIERQSLITMNQHRVLAICHELQGNSNKALVSINMLSKNDDSYQLKNLKVNVLYKMKQFDDALSLLITIPVNKRNDNWHFQKALLHYELGDYDAAIMTLDLKNSLKSNETDLYINSLLAVGNTIRALELTQRQFIDNTDFDSNKWLRLANIYQTLGQKQAYLDSLYAVLEKDPLNENALLALAYALVVDSPQLSLNIFKRLDSSKKTLSPEQYEQMSYLSQRLEQPENTNNYLKRYFETSQTTEQRNDKYWSLRRLFENTEKFWEITLNASHASGAILGDVFFINENGEVSDTLPTNSLAIRAEYFFNSANSGHSVYSQLSSNGNDDDILGNSAIELGVTYKPFDKFNFKVATGGLKFFDNNGDWEGFVKLFGDAFSSHNFRRDWRSTSSWYERLFYYDFTYFYGSKQSIGQAFFEFGKTHNISKTAYRTLKYYGNIRYDYRKIDNISINGKNQFDEVSLGLGIRLDEYFVRPTIDDVLDRFSLAIEARFNVTGNLSQDSNGIFVNTSYEY